MRARNLFQESLQLRRETGNAIGTSVSLLTLGGSPSERTNLARAAANFEEALVLGREVNDTESMAYALDNLVSWP